MSLLGVDIIIFFLESIFIMKIEFALSKVGR